MMNENNSNNNNNKKPGGSWKPLVVMLIISVVLTLLFWGTLERYQQGRVEEIKYSEFMDKLQNDEIKSVEISNNKIVVYPKSNENSFQKVSYTVVRVPYDLKLVDKLEEAGVEYEEIQDNSSAWWFNVLQFLLMLGVIYLVMTLFMRLISKNGMMGGVGKSKAKVYVEKKTGVTFADVAGQEEAKESLVEMVDFLHNPKKYLDIGAKLPKGALLVGPPGTGKTLLAKAVAGEANVPFFSLSGSDFVEMYVGVGASRVRDLFKDANAMAPCIIFIDEIDAIGRSRDTVGHGGDSEREQTLNQLLSEMDGFDTSKGIVILAATNRPEVLDKALLRPGRFDRRVIVEKPDLKGRIDTLKVHSKDVKMDESVNFEELALATSGAVGADLANIVNEAALGAVKAGRQVVSQKDLFEAVEVVFAGKEKKDRIDDALHATRAASEEGIVPGGGVAYIRAQAALEGLKGETEDETTGIEIIKRAIEEPLRQIAYNAGVEGAVVVNKVREGKGDFGYNARKDIYEDLKKAGVIDPKKVTRVALENAASIAGMFLTTECVLVEEKKDEPAAPAMGGGMPGMM